MYKPNNAQKSLRCQANIQTQPAIDRHNSAAMLAEITLHFFITISMDCWQKSTEISILIQKLLAETAGFVRILCFLHCHLLNSQLNTFFSQIFEIFYFRSQLSCTSKINQRNYLYFIIYIHVHMFAYYSLKIKIMSQQLCRRSIDRLIQFLMQ